ncbi:hypothetical protein DFH94DRAFT_858349 [Russula ochroleuca]|uniref:Uncharacterized protein n=1 Tax=Russula ochroleuca TaxID=152965 RepID=A0A9P5JU86_9AGAM|nr:hypothetical protein DFH94DRAFT_858349 [Russula ochroleuca]
MHVLRSTLLGYLSPIMLLPHPAPLHIRTIDPDSSHSTQTPSIDACSPLNRSRETIALDLSIALKVHDGRVRVHLGQPETFREDRDPFDLMQLRASLGSPLYLPRSKARRGRRPLASDGHASVTTHGIADDPLPVMLVMVVGVIAGEVGEGLPSVGCMEAAAAVGEGAAGLGLFSLEGADAGGNVGELGVDVVVAADIGVETPILGRILDLQ